MPQGPPPGQTLRNLSDSGADTTPTSSHVRSINFVQVAPTCPGSFPSSACTNATHAQRLQAAPRIVQIAADLAGWTLLAHRGVVCRDTKSQIAEALFLRAAGFPAGLRLDTHYQLQLHTKVHAASAPSCIAAWQQKRSNSRDPTHRYALQEEGFSLVHPSRHGGIDTIGGIKPQKVSPHRPQTPSGRKGRKPGEKHKPFFLESWGRRNKCLTAPPPWGMNSARPGARGLVGEPEIHLVVSHLLPWTGLLSFRLADRLDWA